MQNERISFDAMPEMLAAIAQKLESIDFQAIQQNRLSMAGQVLTSFLFTRREKVLLSASLRLINGYSKAIERASQISCWRQVNS